MAKVRVKRKTQDNWKKKKWYNVMADPIFDSKEFAKTIAIDSKQLMGRSIEKSLNELTSNIRDSGFVVKFKIHKVTGTTADTKLVEFNTKIATVKRMVRRGKSKIENIFNVQTKDGVNLKIKMMCLSGTKFTTANRTEARKILETKIKEEIKNKTLNEVWNSIFSQNFSEKLKKDVVKLGYISRVAILKAKII